MDPLLFSPILIVGLLFLLGSGIWVAISLLCISLFGMIAFTNAPVALVMPSSIWGALSGWALTALPLFIWMGEILFRSRLSDDLFRGLAPWLGRIPGRLLHVNILACALFAAVSGSSAATAATVGKMTVPELKRRGYNERMGLGSLAASGTLGLLIPPSIILIVYAVSANVSIARLFLAGIVPAAVLITLLMGYVVIWSLIHPEGAPAETESVPWGERIRRLRLLAPLLLLIGGVIGSMYLGFATPTEAATIGVVGSLLFAGLTGGLSWAAFRDSIAGAVRTTCMIGFILGTAAFLTTVMGYTGIPRALAGWIGGMELSPVVLLTALACLFVFLGCFLDGISIVVLTTAVVMPMVRESGIDLIWFGIFMVLIVEIAQITPPVGFNLFVVQALSGRDLAYVTLATVPFFLLMVTAIAILMAFPWLATWLPATMMSR